MRRVLSFTLLAALAACALPQTRWERADADEKTTTADLQTCRRAAQQEAFLDSGSGFIWPWGPRHAIHVEDDRFYAEGRLADFCMRNKGYTLVTIPAAPKAGPEAPSPPAKTPGPPTDQE